MENRSARLQPDRPPLRVAILVDTSTSWGRGVVAGVHRYAQRGAGWHLFVEPRGIEQRRWLPDGWKGDGIIARVGFAELASQLSELGSPIVNVSGITLPKAAFPRVVSDQTAAAELAAVHLISRGFKHFGYFSLVGLEYVAEHREAFAAALAKKGFSCKVHAVRPQIGAEPDWNLDLSRLMDWLIGLPKPVAIFTWNSSSARELIHACLQAGLSVPEEVAVLSGTDDDLFCEVSPVPISAVKLDAETIGFQAAGWLDQMMKGETVVQDSSRFIAPLAVIDRLSTSTLAVDDPAMVRALRYIREHPDQPMQVEDIARHAGLCRRALEQRFKKVLGRSPAAELRRVRIERAVRLLQETNLSISVVAERAGFSSSEYMASVFRSHLSATPLEFRKEPFGANSPGA